MGANVANKPTVNGLTTFFSQKFPKNQKSSNVAFFILRITSFRDIVGTLLEYKYLKLF